MNTKLLIDAIAANMAAGNSLYDAYEHVLGQGSWDFMLESLYRAFQQGSDKVVFQNLIKEKSCEK
jgi:hypothetical protein